MSYRFKCIELPNCHAAQDIHVHRFDDAGQSLQLTNEHNDIKVPHSAVRGAALAVRVVDHVPPDAVLSRGRGGGGGGRRLPPPVALVAHPAGRRACALGAPRVLVAAVAGALQLPVEHQLVEGGPASRDVVGRRRVGIQKAVSQTRQLSSTMLAN